jgi:peptidoglycan hydrolase CwlO-like protein
MDDAYKRLETLNQELNMQLNVTDDIVRQSNAAIAELESKILEIKKQISERKKGQDESKFGIDYETQKILNIVEFINPQK